MILFLPVTMVTPWIAKRKHGVPRPFGVALGQHIFIDRSAVPVFHVFSRHFGRTLASLTVLQTIWKRLSVVSKQSEPHWTMEPD